MKKLSPLFVALGLLFVSVAAKAAPARAEFVMSQEQVDCSATPSLGNWDSSKNPHCQCTEGKVNEMLVLPAVRNARDICVTGTGVSAASSDGDGGVEASGDGGVSADDGGDDALADDEAADDVAPTDPLADCKRLCLAFGKNAAWVPEVGELRCQPNDSVVAESYSAGSCVLIPKPGKPGRDGLGGMPGRDGSRGFRIGGEAGIVGVFGEKTVPTLAAIGPLFAFDWRNTYEISAAIGLLIGGWEERVLGVYARGDFRYKAGGLTFRHLALDFSLGPHVNAIGLDGRFLAKVIEVGGHFGLGLNFFNDRLRIVPSVLCGTQATGSNRDRSLSWGYGLFAQGRF